MVPCLRTVGWGLALLPVVFIVCALASIVSDGVEIALLYLLPERRGAGASGVPFRYKMTSLLGVFALSFWVNDLQYREASNNGGIAGGLYFVLHFAQQRSEVPQTFVVRVYLETIKGSVIALCGHATFVIVAPLLTTTPGKYFSSLHKAPLVGAMGGFLAICVYHLFMESPSDSDKKQATLRHIDEQDKLIHMSWPSCAKLFATNIFFRAYSGAIWLGLVGVLATKLVGKSDMLDIAQSICVGVVGGALMGFNGIRLELW
ncbi:hypothetical protein B0H16DRAFT_1720946 [Mycena metata]|uniref:Uncharacterized protein n=1 Tax=Mycena metata TaxID=1033252 RepID=A0AAD7J8F7_9AGAR|nr:hypothetical protein B0H16DRAFT_1720946 [Mycena metata]